MMKISDFKIIVIVLLLGASHNVFGFMGFGGSEMWKEEVLLHDGSKIVVEREQTHGGRGEIGQSPIKEHSITFTLPGSNKLIIWKDEYSKDVGHSNFGLLALHISNGTPYIVAYPYGCLAYNKWGRPNPPYLLFKFDGNVWQRISLSDFPSELTGINLVINTSAHEKKLVSQRLTSAETVRELNSSLTQVELKAIIRTPLKPEEGGLESCPELVRVKDGWGSPGGAKAPIPISPAR